MYTDLPADVLGKIEDVVLNRRPDASEHLIELAEKLKERDRKSTERKDASVNSEFPDGVTSLCKNVCSML